MATPSPERTRVEACGVLNVNKPAGRTSHDVVAAVRRLTRQRRVGHTGTLDPLATGVLVLCLGQATRLAEYIADAHKTYRATLRFGVLTDTWDAEGQVLETRDASALTLAPIERALEQFRGTIEQVPPMYSALTRGGRPLYELARQGVTVERAPRQVTIYAVEIVSWALPELVLRVTCSSGTYIRSLAHDLGEALGPGAHLAALVREQVGRFALRDALSLDALQQAAEEGSWLRALIPVQQALDLPGVLVGADVADRLANGMAVPLPLSAEQDLGYAYDAQGRLAMVRYSAQTELWQPEKVLSGCPSQFVAEGHGA